MNEMTTLEKEKEKTQEKWLLIELIYGYYLFERNLSVSKSYLDQFSLDELEKIVLEIEAKH
jgi:hypothetical protein